ncbi:hypothetical protein P3B99_005640 [Opitutia bacterium KCR 482]|nr:hypothetical protein [Opitutae bacterium KCR 482]
MKYNGETYNIRGRTGLPFKTICGTPLTCRTLQVVFASLPSSTPLEKKLHPHKKNADINATHTEFAFIHQLKTTLGVISIKKTSRQSANFPAGFCGERFASVVGAHGEKETEEQYCSTKK